MRTHLCGLIGIEHPIVQAAHCRAYLRRYGMACRIARKGTESSERRAAIPEALLHLGRALISWNFLQAESVRDS